MEITVFTDMDIVVFDQMFNERERGERERERDFLQYSQKRKSS
jgi:hypothetical protein